MGVDLTVSRLENYQKELVALGHYANEPARPL